MHLIIIIIIISHELD